MGACRGVCGRGGLHAPPSHPHKSIFKLGVGSRKLNLGISNEPLSPDMSIIETTGQ